MADSTKTVAYEITADHTNFVQGVQAAAGALTGMTNQAQSQFKGLGEAISSIQKPLLAVAAIVGGGSVFKSAIDSANKLNGEAMKLSKALGITGTEAAGLRTALGDIGTDSDTYVGAFQKFAKQIKSNEDGLRAMGLQTRDSNGNLRDSNALFTEALGVVGSYKPGLDQTTAAMTLFGKGVDDVMTLQKLNNQVIDEAKAKNEALGMTMTKEGVAATKAYKMAMNDVGDVMDAVKNTIGKAVMPVFTDLANMFSDVGPQVVQVFKVAMMGVVTVLRVVQGAIETVAGVIKAAYATIIDGAGLTGEVISKLVAGDFSGAAASAKQLGSRIGMGVKEGFTAFMKAGDNVGANVEKDYEALFGKGTAVAAPKGGTNTMGDFSKTNEKKGDKSAIPGFEAQLEAMRLAITQQGLLEGQYRELSKAEEAKFWRDKAAMANMSVEDRAKAAKKASEAELAVIKQGFEAKVAQLNAESALYRNNMDKKLEIEREIQSKYQEGTKEFEAAQGRINAIQRQAAEQTKQVEDIKLQARRNAQLQGIALEEQQAQFEAQAGLITQEQALQLQLQFEARRNAIAAAALEERMQTALRDPDRNPAELARIQAEIEALQLQHQQRVNGILNSLQRQNPMLPVLKSMETSFAQSIGNMLSGAQTLRQGMVSIWGNIRTAITAEIGKILMARVAAYAKERLLSLAGIGAKASEAGAGAAAAVAPIPVVGPALAVGALATVFAAVMGLQGSVPSASGGFDIPGTLNPITQLHAKEMVLPAKYADVIRDMADGGGGGGGNTFSPTIHVQAMDARSVVQTLRQGGALDEALRSMHRDFVRI